MPDIDASTSLPRKRNLFLKFVGAVLLIVLFAFAGIGGAWFYVNREHPVATDATQASEPADATSAVSNGRDPDANAPMPIFVDLTPFTVTLSDNVMERLVHMAITVRLSDEESKERLQRYLPEVRNRVLMILTDQSPETIASTRTRARLSQDISEALSRPFKPLVRGQQIIDVLFTDFVVQ
ncbi:flagellar basal body-associated FliL family protein [Kerstersia gyiorum]|uniref:flagellar basal body-associated FliL family protein n=1 Tax=Kerstersia gyiorum TaxID=206506 RepID=UPI000838AD0D|nr:flagellar basal body-associated FliL family protein [Kerstersia gyiorum]MCP1633271.1 flagellar FliL protein [Kerstersia gyiorum]MCP1636142.1 flagellar FliL protein [Kerstersia gyiorum]MCP1671291.1 flagellar FliL protein [Kerstersia gyiorum]MCP1679054.1 flagellar FliL protein [Kerstersia gyiorum]MCP1681854.1 flagellar FliL protein [Kerstersia gyiorum]